MKYLRDDDCKEYCDYYPVCVKFGKLYREGCVLDGEELPEKYPENTQEREQRLSLLQGKLAKENEILSSK